MRLGGRAPALPVPCLLCVLIGCSKPLSAGRPTPLAGPFEPLLARTECAFWAEVLAAIPWCPFPTGAWGQCTRQCLGLDLNEPWLWRSAAQEAATRRGHRSLAGGGLGHGCWRSPSKRLPVRLAGATCAFWPSDAAHTS